MDNNIKMAYCLLAHSNAKQINMYIAQLLNAGECEIFIHIDKKSEAIRKGIIPIVSIMCDGEALRSWRPGFFS